MREPIERCRSCDAAGLLSILDLGCTPLANALLTAEQLDQPEPTYPLELVFCTACGLVQITATVPPEELFRDYVYLSSFSDTMVEHARSLADRLIATRRLSSGSLVVEAASNDGYLLQHYRRAGVAVLGVEPAANVARVAIEQRGIPTVAEFFGTDLAKRLRGEGKQADVFHAHNVLAHVADLNGFVRGICTILKDDGIAVIEVPYVKELVDRCEFDTIYHEHLCYFSLTALDRLFRRHGLVIRDVEQIPIHGGSLRLFAGHGDAHEAPQGRVAGLLHQEAEWGVDRFAYYRDFAASVVRLKESLRSLVGQLKGAGRRLAAYGASAKGSTLLNYVEIGRGPLEFVADRSTAKQGRYTPGTRLPIRPPASLLEEMPDYVLLLTWNFAEEILAQQAEYRRRGGRFIVPVPAVQVI
ncbi:MAG TPA: class I SAM-dependent methyltransferase [Gemmataceae bacterium]|nr:class I SAM-dependent methyltransferase [Gemmataceae bacterium]